MKSNAQREHNARKFAAAANPATLNALESKLLTLRGHVSRFEDALKLAKKLAAQTVDPKDGLKRGEVASEAQSAFEAAERDLESIIALSDEIDAMLGGQLVAFTEGAA